VLGDRGLLLVLDNFEHVLAAAAPIAALLLRCAGVKALVTSRAPLHVSGEHELPVLPLTLPPTAAEAAHLSAIAQAPAVELWRQRVAAVDPSFALTPDNAPIVVEICRRLDGLPLAIELAAARTRVFPPRTLLERLSHRLHVLTSGPRDLPARQQTLRAALAWSYDLLLPAEQALFRRLSVFQGGCTLEAACAIAGSDAELDAVEDGISVLVDHHLVIRLDPVEGEPRIGQLETLREFGAEQLEASGEAEGIQRAHAEYFTRLAEQAEPILNSSERGPWLRRLDADQANVRAALRWAVEHDEAELGLRLVGAAWLWCWLSFREARRWVESLLALPSAATVGTPRVRALTAAATLAWGQGDGQAVHVLGDEAVRLGRQVGDPRALAHALLAFGASIQLDRAAMEAIDIEAEGLVKGTRHPWWVAFAYLCHAIHAAQRGEAGAARALAADAAARFQHLDDAFFLAIARQQLGLALLQLGQPVEARAELEACLPALREVRDWKFTLVALIGLGSAARVTGDPLGAARSYAEALGLCRDAGAVGDQPLCLEGLASAAFRLGQAPRAARLLGAAQASHAAGFTPTVPGFEPAYAATSRAVGAALDDDRFAAESQTGRGMPLAEILAEAQSVLADRGSPAAATGADRPAIPGSPDGLSQRELEVLRLLASGRSNAEIAAELVLSVRTVEKHVANIYAKIGARGRADAATYALRQGLLPSTR
jgi:non-specific serine/threonine protein kinase